jgi:hypothetical protein
MSVGQGIQSASVVKSEYVFTIERVVIGFVLAPVSVKNVIQNY